MDRRVAYIITRECCSFYGVHIREAFSVSRVEDAVLARHVSMLIIKRSLEWSDRRIGKLFGRHPTTVMAARRSINNRIETDPAFAQEIHLLHSFL